MNYQHNVIFLLTQPSSPPEDPLPPPPSKDKDNNGSKKLPSKGKAAAGSQQVDVHLVCDDESLLRMLLTLPTQEHEQQSFSLVEFVPAYLV